MNIFAEPPGPGYHTILEEKSPNVQGHSWFGKTAHLLRPGRKMLRCTIGEFVLKPCFVGLNVRFQENGTKKNKNVSPLLLLSVNLFWVSNEFGSDEEDDSATRVLRPEMLPKLRIWTQEKFKFSQQQLEAIHWNITQADLLLNQYLPVSLVSEPDHTSESSSLISSSSLEVWNRLGEST